MVCGGAPSAATTGPVLHVTGRIAGPVILTIWYKRFLAARDAARPGSVMSTIAFLTLAVAAAAVLGILIGSIRIKGIGIGIGGVLFSGIFVGHMLHEHAGFEVRTIEGLTAEGSILGYVQEFGLILFVYAIGIQVGPSFFASLRSMGAKMNGWAVLIILMGCVLALGMHAFGLVPIDVMVGMYSGAITNTPALGAGTSMIRDVAAVFAERHQSVPPGLTDTVVSSAYAMAYPFGVCGVLLAIILVRLIFGISIEDAAKAYDENKKKNKPKINTVNVTVLNDELFGKTVDEMLELLEVKEHGIVCSRVKRGEDLTVPSADFRLQKGDILHIVGTPGLIGLVARSIGKMSDADLTSKAKGSHIHVNKIIVTNPHYYGRHLGDLHLETRYDLVVSRLERMGFEYVPTHDMRLQFGDVLNVVGEPNNIKEAADMVGNSKDKLNKAAMLPMFVGIFLGIFLGNIPIQFPCVPTPIKLGLAGGPLIAAIFLARFGSTWTFRQMSWYMPPAGMSALRELGITLFLSIVGINAGASGFWDTLTNGPGLTWLGYGTIITFVPIMTVGILAYKIHKINYLVLSGMLAGASTSPPALAFSNSLHSDPEASSVGYATVYPLTMFLRILSAQLLVIIALMFT